MASTQPSRKTEPAGLNYTLVTETFPPEINGVSMTLGRLVSGLEANQFQVTVIAPARKDRKPVGSHQLVEVAGLPIPRYTELRFGLPAYYRIRRLWSSNPPHLVHIATEGPLGWSALRVARRLKIPVVSSFHTNFHSYGRHYGFGLLQPLVLGWLRRFHNRTLRTFVPSDDLITRLSADGFKRLRLLARGVDTRLYGPHQRSEALRKSWGAGPETPVVLYVGRLAGEKNLDLVVEGFRQIQHKLPNAVLVLVGDGPDRMRLERRIPEARFAGMQTGQALAAHYASADTFLFASINRDLWQCRHRSHGQRPDRPRLQLRGTGSLHQVCGENGLARSL
jgi:glycosyltransferase involved in cell wall biosynthesis